MAFEDGLRVEDGVANASGLDVEFSQSGGQKFRRGVSLNGQAIFFESLVREFAAAVDRDLFLIHVRQRVVVIGRGAVQLMRGSLRRFGGCALGVGWFRLGGRFWVFL